MTDVNTDTPPPHWPKRTAVPVGGLTLAAIIAATLVAAGHSGAAVTLVSVVLTATTTGYLCRRGERRRAAQVWAAAHRDALTSLPTRAVFEQQLAAATGTSLAASIALADADDLKQVNAAAGYAAGDQYLRGIAGRLAAATPTHATLARLGGDEFVILAPGTEPHQLAAAVAHAITEAVTVAGERVPPRVSVGIAAGTGNAWATLAQADAALHTAKQTGGQILVYNPARDGIPHPDGTRPPRRRRDQRPDTGPVWVPATDTAARLVCSLTDLATILRALRTAHDWWTIVLNATGAASNDQATPTAEVARARMASYAELAARIAPILQQNEP